MEVGSRVFAASAVQQMARTLCTAHGVTWRVMATEFLAFKTKITWADVKFAVSSFVANAVPCLWQGFHEHVA